MLQIMTDQAGRMPHRWKPGMPSPNPTGRPKTGFAFTEMVRAVAGQPGVMRALVLRMIDVAMGRSICVDPEWQKACQEARAAGLEPPPEPPNGERVQPTIGEQQRAWEALLRYGGIATQQIAVDHGGAGGPVMLDFGALSQDELDAMERSLAKAAGASALPKPPPK